MGVDYNNTVCQLVFPAGSVAGTIRSCFITISDDALEEGDETISVTGSTATTVLPFTTTVIITDDDSKSSHRFSQIGLFMYGQRQVCKSRGPGMRA